jgi:hypothetical protein
MAQKYSSVDLQKWLLEKAQSVSSDQARKVISYNDQRSRDTALIGRLYFFKYVAKYKDVLPKYDRFPMAMPLEKYSGGFLGINLHYLDVDARQTLITRLLDFRNNNYMDFRTKINVSYDLVSRTRGLVSLSRPCIKRYLFNQVKSQFIEIYPEEYDKAVQLPVEEWVFKR